MGLESNVDLVVIGGGLVGLSTAYQYLLAHPGSQVLVLEKERAVCQHQSGRNSGVIHSGIYYKPGSLKALNCRRGKAMLEDFCSEHAIAWKKLGKVIVATNEKECAALTGLHQRGLANGVEVELISKARLLELEPAVAGLQALHVPETGVVDYKAVAEKLVELIKKMGGNVVCAATVTSIQSEGNFLRVLAGDTEVLCRKLVNCAGLYSDKILELCGLKPEVRIVPFRGEYYFLSDQAAELCKTLIYPVPNPEFPFLGVHFTRGVHGEVDCGPNAVLAFAREGYTFGTINFSELFESLTFPGFQKLVLKNWRYALREVGQSLSKALFVKAAQNLIPDIKSADLRVAPAGVRAQAVSSDGKPVDDFLLKKTPNAIHVLNAPSPAATSCLSIGSNICGFLK